MITSVIVINFCIFCLLALLLWQLATNLRRYKLRPDEHDEILRLDDTPTVSLCIPARNETHALEDCLASAIASDYPKLEIIVLDDCSQDHTSQIIKGFAHDGVRFVKGETPSDGWLGKNHAYEVLATEARGDYIVFMSVDTRLEPTSLSTLVGYMQMNKLAMTSVLPRRADAWRSSVLFAPLRYFWQVVLPLGLNTPTATSLWAIRADSLISIGGFAAYKDKIMLENILARQFFAKSQYRFLIANDQLKLWYAKKWRSQCDTAIRLWYPTLKKSLVVCFLVIFAHLLLFIVPLLSIVVSLAIASLALFLISFCIFLLQFLLFFIYLRQVHIGPQIIFGTILLPIMALQEVVLIVMSAFQYKRGHVDWKGRNVCYRVLKRPDNY